MIEPDAETTDVPKKKIILADQVRAVMSEVGQFDSRFCDQVNEAILTAQIDYYLTGHGEIRCGDYVISLDAPDGKITTTGGLQ